MAQLAPAELIQQLRFPKQVFTDSYLDDPIAFAPDPRFEPVTVLKQLNVIPIANRDAAAFSIILLNGGGPQNYTTPMYSAVYDRLSVENVEDTKKEFTFFTPENLGIG